MIQIAEGLAEYVASSSGAAHVELRTTDLQNAVSALTAARRALVAIPHPEAPDDSLTSFASDVTATERGATFWFDAADAEAYDDLIDRVIEVLRQALEDAGAGGALTWPEGP